MACTEEFRPYLQEEATQEKITDIDIDNLCRLPHGNGRNEWLATHSKYHHSVTQSVTVGYRMAMSGTSG